MSFVIPPGMSLAQMLEVMTPQAEQPLEMTVRIIGDEPAKAAKRARLKGRFRADDPATPDVDEAWETES